MDLFIRRITRKKPNLNEPKYWLKSPGEAVNLFALTSSNGCGSYNYLTSILPEISTGDFRGNRS